MFYIIQVSKNHLIESSHLHIGWKKSVSCAVNTPKDADFLLLEMGTSANWHFWNCWNFHRKDQCCEAEDSNVKRLEKSKNWGILSGDRCSIHWATGTSLPMIAYLSNVFKSHNKPCDTKESTTQWTITPPNEHENNTQTNQWTTSGKMGPFLLTFLVSCHLSLSRRSPVFDIYLVVTMWVCKVY